MYKIKTIKNQAEIDTGNIANIDKYNWGGEYKPISKAILCFIKDEGFILKIMSDEKNPLARFTEENSPVHRDSCLEFFANFKPQIKGIGYLNFEANPNGSLWAAIGEYRDQREFTKSLGIKQPKPIPFKENEFWGYTLFIPLEFIQSVYQNSEFKSGDIIKGSFYKCGDDTKNPHFASFNEIKTEHPDFHCPEYFVDMVIE